MKAKSIHGQNTDSIAAAIEASLLDGFKPTIAIVFVSVTQERQAICEILKEKNLDIFGASSAGEFIDGHESKGEWVILLLAVKKENYQLVLYPTKNKSASIIAQEAALKAKEKFSRPAFILCTTCLSEAGDLYDGAAVIHSIQDTVGNQSPIFGAIAGDDAMMTGTYVFSNEGATDEGFVLLALDNDQIDLYGMAISGWKPMGKIRTVSKAEDGWLYELDGQPALEMYLRYLGQSLRADKEVEKTMFVEQIGFFYPFLSIGAGEPTLRTPLEVSEEKNALKLDFPVEVGTQLQFTMPPDFDIVETVLDTAASLKSKENASADALLIFSCLGRCSALGPLVSEENEGLHKIWNVPMAGFYSYGEFGNDPDSENVFHSTTCSWVALKEK